MVLQTIDPLVSITGSKIHGSPAERKMAISTLMSMVQFYGCPSIFFTFAPEDIHSILTLRMCCPTQNGNDKFPALDSSFEKMLRERDEKENDGSILNDAWSPQVVRCVSMYIAHRLSIFTILCYTTT